MAPCQFSRFSFEGLERTLRTAYSYYQVWRRNNSPNPAIVNDFMLRPITCYNNKEPFLCQLLFSKIKVKQLFLKTTFRTIRITIGDLGSHFKATVYE